MITTLDLFAGIGGFALGLEATGFFRTTCFVENEPYCQAVLRHHWPDVPVLGDIRDVRREDLPDPNPGLICGGFPCQPFSHAGKQRAQDDPRHLWPEMLRLIRECRPDWVIGENVTGLIKLGLDEVLSDLEGEGYATRTFNIPACAVGAPHIRQRLWVVAHAHSESEPDGAFDGNAGQRQLGFGFMADADSDDGGREGSSKSLGRETRLEHSGCGTQRDMADAKRKGKGRRRVSGPRKDKSEDRQGPSDKSRGCREDVADTRIRRQRGAGEGQVEQSGGAEVERTGQTVADAKSAGSQARGRDGMGTANRSRRNKGQSARTSSKTDVADAKRTGTGVEEHRGGGQGRESSRSSQPEVLRQEDGTGGAEGIAANGGGSEDWWAVEPDVGRVAHGVPARVAQLRALGNAIVPQIAQEIGNAIKGTY